MSKPKTELKIRDKHLIRLEQWGRIRHRQAVRLAKLGDVELYTFEISFDNEFFQYPFGNVGTHEIYSVRTTDQGRARIGNIIETDLKAYKRFLRECCKQSARLDSGGNQILYTDDGARDMLTFGKRDQLYVFNRQNMNNPDDEFDDEDDIDNSPRWTPSAQMQRYLDRTDK